MCAICICGMSVGFSFSVTSLASVSAISFPVIHKCARTLCMWIVCGVQYIWCPMVDMSNFLGWWCCDVGCCMWLLIRYMCMSRWGVCMFLMAISIALSSTRRMFWYPGSLFVI